MATEKTAANLGFGKVWDTAISAIEDNNKSIKNVLPKVYGNPSLNKNI